MRIYFPLGVKISRRSGPWSSIASLASALTYLEKHARTRWTGTTSLARVGDEISPLHGIGGVGVWCSVCVHILCYMSWNNVDIYKTTNRDSAKYFAGKKGDSTNALNLEA
jgi:hypothetical protein